MIWVVGLPRTGTSMRMAQLVASGMWAIAESIGMDAPAWNPGGLFEHPAVWVRPVETLAPYRDRADVCAKVWPRCVPPLLAAGIVPAAVLVTDRPGAESDASWAQWFPPASAPNDGRAENREITLAALAAAEVPTLTVPFHAAIDRPHEDAERLAAFLAPWAALDPAAMAAVPDPGLRHFGARPPVEPSGGYRRSPDSKGNPLP